LSRKKSGKKSGIEEFRIAECGIVEKRNPKNLPSEIGWPVLAGEKLFPLGHERF
jgi:hypothetical protein